MANCLFRRHKKAMMSLLTFSSSTCTVRVLRGDVFAQYRNGRRGKMWAEALGGCRGQQACNVAHRLGL